MILTVAPKERQRAMSKDFQNLNSSETSYERSLVNPTSVEALAPYQKLSEVVCPQICVWYFMSRAELSAFMQIESKAKIREAIGNTAYHF